MAWFEENQDKKYRYLLTIVYTKLNGSEMYEVKGNEHSRNEQILKHFLRQFEAEDNVEMGSMDNSGNRYSTRIYGGPRHRKNVIALHVLESDYDKLCTQDSVNFKCFTDYADKEDFLKTIKFIVNS